MKEAFVYSWRNKADGRLYIGWHKGSQDDGYICSSKKLLEEYTANPDNFERFIIAHGSAEDMANLESAILSIIDAKNNLSYYNQHNGNGLYHLKSHTAESKRKIAEAKRGKKRPDLALRNIHNNPAKNPETAKKMGRDQSGENNVMHGKRHSLESKKKMSASLLGKNKTPKSEETKKKMAEARRLYWLKKKGIA